MGLALLVFLLKAMAIRGQGTVQGQVANAAVRFWLKIFGVTFVMGVITGIPMEFQFGTNWSRFSAVSGGIIGQTLAMEGVFAFFWSPRFSISCYSVKPGTASGCIFWRRYCSGSEPG